MACMAASGARARVAGAPRASAVLPRGTRARRAAPVACAARTETEEAKTEPAQAETGADAQPAAPTKPKGPVEVTMVLESKMIAGGLVRFKEGRTPANTSLVVVDDVYDEGEAYRRGLRRGMVLKAMTGTNGDERTEMWELDDKVSLRYIKETIRLARYPMTMIFLEGADVRPTPAEIAAVVGNDAATASMTESEMRIARRKAYQEIDDSRNDFPLVGALLALVIVPPIVVLALNSYFHWA